MRPEAQRFQFESGIGALSDESLSESAGNFSEAEPLASAGSLTELKPLGQVNSSFIVAVNGEGLWIIDQHVAHERVLFEQHLRARREGQLTGQRMLVPMMVELSPRQIVIFERIAEELTANGFEVAQMGPRSVAIHAAPAGIATSDAERLLMEILDGTERENAAISMDSLQAKIAASTSCHAAIKVNMPLDQKKMEWLLAELAKTEAPMSCPHGRPIVLRYSMREIERAFKRISMSGPERANNERQTHHCHRRPGRIGEEHGGAARGRDAGLHASRQRRDVPRGRAEGAARRACLSIRRSVCRRWPKRRASTSCRATASCTFFSTAKTSRTRFARRTCPTRRPWSPWFRACGIRWWPNSGARATQGGVVMEGRDIGSVVFPHADLKIFLDASPEVRASRRQRELEEKGESLEFAMVLAGVHERDRRDREREMSPLVRAADAVVVDNTAMDAEETARAIVLLAREKARAAVG